MRMLCGLLDAVCVSGSWPGFGVPMVTAGGLKQLLNRAVFFIGILKLPFCTFYDIYCV